METSITLPLCSFAPLDWYRRAMGHEVMLDVHENYIKQTYRNRYDILGVNGKMTLTIPVVGQKGAKTPSKDIRIAEDNWRKIHLRSIRSVYGRAAFFEYYIDEIEKPFVAPHKFLMDFNLHTLKCLESCGLQVDTKICSDAIEFNPESLTTLYDPKTLHIDFLSYPQVFSDRFPFQPGLSIIDLVMNKGPRSKEYLESSL